MTEVLLTLAFICYCGVWLITQWTMTFRLKFNPVWAFNFAALWPITFVLALCGYNFERYRVTK